jgi:hypothetical protein
MSRLPASKLPRCVGSHQQATLHLLGIASCGGTIPVPERVIVDAVRDVTNAAVGHGSWRVATELATAHRDVMLTSRGAVRTLMAKFDAAPEHFRSDAVWTAALHVYSLGRDAHVSLTDLPGRPATLMLYSLAKGGHFRVAHDEYEGIAATGRFRRNEPGMRANMSLYASLQSSQWAFAARLLSLSIAEGDRLMAVTGGSLCDRLGSDQWAVAAGLVRAICVDGVGVVHTVKQVAALAGTPLYPRGSQGGSAADPVRLDALALHTATRAFQAVNRGSEEAARMVLEHLRLLRRPASVGRWGTAAGSTAASADDAVVTALEQSVSWSPAGQAQPRTTAMPPPVRNGRRSSGAGLRRSSSPALLKVSSCLDVGRWDAAVEALARIGSTLAASELEFARRALITGMKPLGAPWTIAAQVAAYRTDGAPDVDDVGRVLACCSVDRREGASAALTGAVTADGAAPGSQWRAAAAVVAAAMAAGVPIGTSHVARALTSEPPWRVALAWTAAHIADADLQTPAGAELIARAATVALAVEGPRQSIGVQLCERILAARGDFNAALLALVPDDVLARAAATDCIPAGAICHMLKKRSDWLAATHAYYVAVRAAAEGKTTKGDGDGRRFVDQDGQRSALLDLVRSLRSGGQWEGAVNVAGGALAGFPVAFGSPSALPAPASCAVAAAVDSRAYGSALALLQRMHRHGVSFGGNYLRPLAIAAGENSKRLAPRDPKPSEEPDVVPVKSAAELADDVYTAAVDLLGPQDRADPRTAHVMLGSYGSPAQARMCLRAFDTLFSPSHVGASGSASRHQRSSGVDTGALRPVFVNRAVDAAFNVLGQAGWQRALLCCREGDRHGLLEAEALHRFMRHFPDRWEYALGMAARHPEVMSAMPVNQIFRAIFEDDGPASSPQRAAGAAAAAADADNDAARGWPAKRTGGSGSTRAKTNLLPRARGWQ